MVGLLVGAAMLFLGRKLFWLFVAAAGFVLGLVVAPGLFPRQPDWLVLAVAIIFGLLGAGLAVVIQKVAVTIAGFVLGAYALVWVVMMLNLHPGPWVWLIGLAGGIGGAMLSAFLFELALIALSTLVGAMLVVQGVNLGAGASALLFLGLLVVGVVVQVNMWQED